MGRPPAPSPEDAFSSRGSQEGTWGGLKGPELALSPEALWPWQVSLEAACVQGVDGQGSASKGGGG